MVRCWPLPCHWPERPSCRKRGCFAVLADACGRGCLAFRAGRAAKGHHPDAVATAAKSWRSCRAAPLLDDDGIREAMDSVYIDSDVLISPLVKKDSQGPCSVVKGAQGLPNSEAPFFQARAEASRRRVWLVVNLQHPENEACVTLNCEVWGQTDFCEDVFAKKATLWQRDVGHPQAEQFLGYYFDGRRPSPQECPAVIIVDPRTGRALRRWRVGTEEFPLDADEALQRMNLFFDMHTLEGNSPPESPQHTPQASPQNSPAIPPEIGLEDVDEMILDNTSFMEDADSASPGATADDSEGAVRVLFRFPDGLRCERSFSNEDTLAHVTAAAARGPHAGGLLATPAASGSRERAGSDVLLEFSTPERGQQALHTLPAETPVGSLDVHRKVLNVRWRS